MGALTRDIEAKRDKGLERAKAAVDSERYRKLGLRAALWIIDGEWARTGDEMAVALRDRPAVEFAAEILARRDKKISKKARRIEQLDPRRRHKLRIAVKKLRYATEFYAGLFGGGKRGRRFAMRLKALQGALGRLNDLEVHKRVADGIVHHGRSPRRADRALAIGFINGHEQTEIAPAITAVAKSAKRLGRATPFW